MYYLLLVDYRWLKFSKMVISILIAKNEFNRLYFIKALNVCIIKSNHYFQFFFVTWRRIRRAKRTSIPSIHKTTINNKFVASITTVFIDCIKNN